MHKVMKFRFSGGTYHRSYTRRYSDKLLWMLLMQCLDGK